MLLAYIFESFDKIEKTRSRKEKTQLFAELVDNPVRREIVADILNYTYNPFYLYRVYPSNTFTYETTDVDASLDDPLMWKLFKDILDNIREGKISGNDARDAIDSFLEIIPSFYAHWLAAVVNRDLKIGLQWGTFGKFYPNLIRGISP